MALIGYFDDVRLRRDPELTGVAGFLFQYDGLIRFNEQWASRVAGLRKPYRTAACFAHERPFDDWPYEDCQTLMKDLAALTAETRDAGFVAAVEVSEYEDFVADQPRARLAIGHPYTLTLLALVSSIVDYVGKEYPDETVFLFFEKGDAGPEKQAEAFLRRASASWNKVGNSIIEGYRFISKKKAPALCAADFLAWEWQRNYYEAVDNETRGDPAGPYRENFKLLFKDNNSKPICRTQLGRRNLELIAMIKEIARLHKD